MFGQLFVVTAVAMLCVGIAKKLLRRTNFPRY